MLALIDSDSLLYRCGFASEEDSLGIALARLDETLTALIEDELDECTDHKFFISGSTNFRNELAKTHPYKGNRENIKRPTHLKALKEHIVKKWGASISNNKEADDDVCIAAYANPKSIIAHIDKDLDQIPGSHYNYVKKQFYNIGKFEGLKKFYLQILTGDKIDNIIGLRGIGPVKAEKILKDCYTELELYKAVISAYNNIDRVHENAQLLHLLRYEEDQWMPPEEK